MKKTNQIEHEGIVKEISDTTIKVGIISKAACISCQIKGICSPSDVNEKIIEIPKSNYQVKYGDKINLVLKESLGIKALFIGYLLPFILIILTLILSSKLTNNELIIGISSLLILLPYYLIVYYLKSYLKKIFTYSIKQN